MERLRLSTILLTAGLTLASSGIEKEGHAQVMHNNQYPIEVERVLADFQDYTGYPMSERLYINPESYRDKVYPVQVTTETFRRLGKKTIIVETATVTAIYRNNGYTYFLGPGHLLGEKNSADDSSSGSAMKIFSPRPPKINIVRGGRKVSLDLIIQHPSRSVDIGIYRTKERFDFLPVQIAGEESYRVGTDVVVISCPNGKKEITFGKIRGKPCGEKCNPHTFGFDAEINKGSSGGLVLTESGLYLGSVAGIYDEDPNINSGVRATSFENLLGAIISDYNP